eukprot:TRINITY_DN18532_c0_g1_i1.p1 TRINITY_DN18532_c0_g1~~TRINITY_DN18532_c0_g1_i1.p1  ORF type:complete len:423 (+),score=55.07 TRINITY_DN18532_c0_g1_i1:115-1383(+)
MNPFNVERAYRGRALCFLGLWLFAMATFMGTRLFGLADLRVETSTSTKFGLWPTIAVCSPGLTKWGCYDLRFSNLVKNENDEHPAGESDFDVYIGARDGMSNTHRTCAYFRPKNLTVSQKDKKEMIFVEVQVSLEAVYSEAKSQDWYMHNSLLRLYDDNMFRAGDIGFPKLNPQERCKDTDMYKLETLDAGLAKHRKIYQSEQTDTWKQLWDMVSFRDKFQQDVYTAETHYLEMSVKSLPLKKFEDNSDKKFNFTKEDCNSDKLKTTQAFIALKAEWRERGDNDIVTEYEFIHPVKSLLVTLSGLGGFFTILRLLWVCCFPQKYPNSQIAVTVARRTFWTAQGQTNLMAEVDPEEPETASQCMSSLFKSIVPESIRDTMHALARTVCCCHRDRSETQSLRARHAEELICFRTSNTPRYDHQL